MSEEVKVIDESTDKPAKSVYGGEVKYKLGNEEVSIVGWILDDGGVMWEFRREGRVYPLRLSRTGMDAMVAVWHGLMWSRPSGSDAGERP